MRFLYLAAAVAILLSACGQETSHNSTDNSTDNSTTASPFSRPDLEQKFLDLRKLSDEDSQREKNAPNSVILDQIDWEISVKQCKALHVWEIFDKWTGRVESIEQNSRGLKLKVDLNNNGRRAFYISLYGTVPKKSPIYNAVVGLRDGGSTGSPVLVSGRFTLPPIKSYSYSPDNTPSKIAVKFCSDTIDIPVIFTSVEPVAAIAE